MTLQALLPIVQLVNAQEYCGCSGDCADAETSGRVTNTSLNDAVDEM
jgi:hypothetical protein